MNILITGSSGFIGSNLIKTLLDNENEVFGLTRHNGFDLSQKGFSNKIEVKNIDFIIHFAQSTKYRNFPDEVEDIYNVNCNSTLELLEWGRKNGIKKFILASSGNVYKSSNQPLKEYDRLEPNSFYGSTKLIAEELTRNYSIFFDVVILRIFGCYGPDQRNMLIPNMIENIKQGNEISLAQGAGLYINPIYINDFITILNVLMTMEQRNKVEIYNIGGDKTYSLFDIVDIISKKVNMKANIRFNDNEVNYLVGDISKIKDYYKEFVTIENVIGNLL